MRDAGRWRRTSATWRPSSRPPGDASRLFFLDGYFTMQSPSHSSPARHVAIIPAGSGRWAVARGLPRSTGHRAGLRAVRRTVSAAPGLGIRTLTLFAFSMANWRRPEDEVEALMDVFRSYLTEELSGFVGAGTRVSVLGRRDR